MTSKLFLVWFSMMIFGGWGEDHNLATYNSTVIEWRAMPRSREVILVLIQPIWRSIFTDAFVCTQVFFSPFQKPLRSITIGSSLEGMHRRGKCKPYDEVHCGCSSFGIWVFGRCNWRLCTHWRRHNLEGRSKVHKSSGCCGLRYLRAPN